MENKEANNRYKIIQFFDKYRLEAFGVSRRTIHRWKSKLKDDISALKSKSTNPKYTRTPT